MRLEDLDIDLVIYNAKVDVDEWISLCYIDPSMGLYAAIHSKEVFYSAKLDCYALTSLGKRRLLDRRQWDNPRYKPLKEPIESRNGRQLGLVIDHIIPIKGKLVSGLNVPWNMQLISSAENYNKSNWFDDTFYQNWRKNPTGPLLRPRKPLTFK